MQDYNPRPVDVNDTFQFQCSRCCQCCKNVYQAVMTSTYDIFRIAKFENRHMEDIVIDYTEPVIISEPPTVPIMMLKTIGTGKSATCCLLEKRRCKIQEAKPLVCRLYPLNLEPNKDMTGFIPWVVSQKPHHYVGKAHIVGDWMKENMDDIEETATLWWYKVAGEIGKLIKYSDKAAENQEWVMKKGIIHLYCNYDINKDFLSQYAFNLNRLLNELREHL